MAGEKKRPRGLKGSAAAKKAKLQENTESSEIPENAQTIVIEKEVEEGDELGEVAALLESALEKLETDPAAALPLLRGTIHESDQILRKWNSEETLPPLFYYNYGISLFELGRLTEDEEFEPFLDAAEERLEDSLGCLKEDAVLESKIHVALGKVWFSKAAMQVSEEGDVPELASRALASLNKATETSQLETKVMIELADIVQNHGALYSTLDVRNQFISWAEEKLEAILKDEPSHAQALSGLGLCKLQLAHYWLDNAMGDDDEEEEEEEEKTELSNEEQEAYKAILESKKYLELAREEFTKQDKLMPPVLADLGEIYLNEANLVLDEKEQNEIYAKATQVIQEAQKIIQEKQLDYELPEILIAFVEEQ